VERLLTTGHEVVGLSRERRESDHTSLSWTQGDVATGAGLAAAAEGVDAVVHLVGIIRESRNLTFEAAHVDGTRHVLAAARKAGVERLLHMSALGVEQNSPSQYRRTKARAEGLV